MPTITDCNLVLGHLSEDNFLGGRMRLDIGRGATAVEEKVARPLGMGVPEAAEGIARIIDVKMEEAIKAISTMRGHDLRDFMLLAFGGAGPVHAGRIARELGMAGMIVPLYPGVYSAIGLIMSDVKHDYIQSQHDSASRTHASGRQRHVRTAGGAAADELHDDGFAPDKSASSARSTCAMPARATRSPCHARRSRCAAAGSRHCAGSSTTSTSRCSATTRRRSRSRSSPTACAASASCRRSRCRGSSRPAPRSRTRCAKLGPCAWMAKDIDCPIYQRERLDVGLTLTGPAILDQFDCTTVIYSGQTARVDEYKNLVVT